MKVNLVATPPPLPFGEGDSAFSLRLKRWDGDARAAVIDAMLSVSLKRIHQAVAPLVIGWENVTDDNDNAISFDYADKAGQPCTRFNEFAGAVSVPQQIKMYSGIMAFIGIPQGDIEQVVQVLTPGTKVDTDPTTPPGASTSTTASGG